MKNEIILLILLLAWMFWIEILTRRWKKDVTELIKKSRADSKRLDRKLRKLGLTS